MIPWQGCKTPHGEPCARPRLAALPSASTQDAGISFSNDENMFIALIGLINIRS
jgi:hypothetical protein